MRESSLPNVSVIATMAVSSLVFIGFSNRVNAQALEFLSGGGLVQLEINSATAGSEPDEQLDTSGTLYWDANFGTTTKLTVGTICPGQSFSLYVRLDVTSWGSGTLGTPQPETALTDGMVASDLLRDIPSSSPGRMGQGTIRFRAVATVSDGTSAEHGDDYHSLTFTLLEQ